MKVKICGLTRPQDVEAVNEAAPDYAGFVFAEGGRRCVSPAMAASLRAGLKEGIVPVGVFVNAPENLVRGLFRDGVISAAQLHGGESEEFISLLKADGIPVIQAVRAGTGDVASDLADYHLYDGPSGGSGTPVPRAVSAGAVRPVFLAGGIDASNVHEALICRPYGVDVSSGVESGGLKDRKKILAFVELVRGARL